MSLPTPPVPLDDYEAISAAVMETERGRWFLTEFTRRNRAADTASVLSALDELEGRLAQSRRPRRDAEASPNPDRLAGLLRRIADRAALLRNELDAAGSDRHVARALRQLGHLDRLLGLAVLATGGEPLAQPALPHLPDDADLDGEADADAGAIAEAMETPAPLAAPVETDEKRTAAKSATHEAAGPAEAPAERAPEDRPDAARVPSAVSSSKVFINGHPIEIFDDVDAFEADDAIVDPLRQPGSAAVEPISAPVARSQPVLVEIAEQAIANGAAAALPARPKLPPAWTPKLLDSLSDEEKSVLFA